MAKELGRRSSFDKRRFFARPGRKHLLFVEEGRLVVARRLSDNEIVRLQVHVLPDGDVGIDEGYAAGVWRLNLWKLPPREKRP
jgi:hypothetical protein